jgi:ferrous iron transport protein B
MTNNPTLSPSPSHVLVREPLKIDYGPAIEAELSALSALIAAQPVLSERYLPRWLALKLLEGEAGIDEAVAGLPGGPEVLAVAEQSRKRLHMKMGDALDAVIADRRYAFVSAVAGEVIHKPEEEEAPTITDLIDSVVTHRWLGIPIFLLVMYLMFNMVINVATPYTDWVDSIITGPFTGWVAALLAALRAPEWLASLMLDGVIAGVGGVVIFVPSLLVLYFFITILEDSGYMARAAFITDRLMSAFGLHGKSFIPLILGFGCSVPAIYATRTLRSPRDRLLTSLMVPLMSCSARLPVYVVFAMALFPHHAGVIVWGLYALGALAATLIGIVFSRTLFKGVKKSAFVLELPPYRMPLFRNLWRYSWQRIGRFLKQAGTVIFAASVVIWLMLNLPWGVENRQESLYGRLSQTIAPVFAPAGFGNWESAGALVTGFVAKEAVVATMSQIFVGAGRAEAPAEESVSFVSDLRGIGAGFLTATVETGKAFLEALTPGVTLFPSAQEDAGAGEDTALSQALRQHFSTLSALSFLAFVLLYVPCVATLGALKSEFGWKWALFAAAYQTGMAWVAATVIYQGGRLLGLA